MSALSILAEECELLNDSKYRSFITQVEKALKNFEYTSEWADLISALGKLNKVLLGHVKYPVIPKRVTIGKRLAQCLHPALPSGVHLKALETYDIIFKCIGTQRLAQDLFIYSAGLFPLLGHAAMNVKPVLLMIYERHFLGLGKQIKPGLNGLLLGLLPGLEEGSELFDRTNVLLGQFCEATESAYFYTCLWECVHSCPSVRLPAVTFMLTHFNKKHSMEDQLYMMGVNINLMVDAVCNAVQDSSALVQRSLLDFLLMAFPLHNSQLTHSDMAKIVKTSINVLLRRDMSLNRRFYAWLLGTSGSAVTFMAETTRLQRGDKSVSDVEQSYFQIYSKDLLVQALKFKLAESHENSNGLNLKNAVLKPFRILISLLDKPEIGPVILEDILISIFRCLYKEFKSSIVSQSVIGNKKSKPDTIDKASVYSELIKTANVLFGTFEPYFIWEYTAQMFEKSCQTVRSKGNQDQPAVKKTSVSRQGSTVELPDIPTIPELCQLIMFLMDVIALETFMEIQTEHLPRLLCRIISSLTSHCDVLCDTNIICSIQLCAKTLSKVQPSMTHDQTPEVETQIDPSVKQDPVILSLEEAIDLNNKLKEESQKVADGNSETNKSENEVDKNVETSDGNSQETKAKQLSQPVDKPSELPAPAKQVSTTGNQQQKADELRKRKDSASGNLMQTCVECFKKFFQSLSTEKIIVNAELVSQCVKSLTFSADKGSSSDKDSAVDMCSESSPDNDGRECPGAAMKILFDGGDKKRLELFASVCQLLVEFASFPIYCSEQQRDLDGSLETLPVWVQNLMTCCCSVDNFEIQSSAVSAMLDLVVLTQSVQAQNQQMFGEREGEGAESGQEEPRSRSSIIIMPALHPQHLKFLAQQTQFYKTVASIFWDYLGESTLVHHHQTVKLFNILHQVAPSGWVCENVIGAGLVSESEEKKIDAFKKFSVLWHLTRTRKTEVIPGKPLRTYDRSMFVLLDSLREEWSPVKVITSTWLTHVIQYGDIGRLMEPILLMLLHPDTARVSVQHVNIHKPRKVHISESNEEDDSEANIYAISSTGGNVIYHVNKTKDVGKKGKIEDTTSFALTVLNSQGTSTAPTRSISEQEFHFDKVNPNDLNLRINPFGSESSLDKLIFDGFELPPSLQQSLVTKARRLDKETCAKEGISFVDGEGEDSHSLVSERSSSSVDKLAQENEEREEDESVKEEECSTDEIIREILEDLINLAVGADTGTSVQTETGNGPMMRSLSLTSSSAGDHELLNSINKKGSAIDSPTASELEMPVFKDSNPDEAEASTDIHALHMHMLLYTQKYDYERTLYALSTLKAMLVCCPRLLVTSLVTTNISAMRTSQLAKLQLMLARHRKSVFGQNFFGEIPSDVMSNYRSNMFIEILISLCLYFIRSYYPNLMMSKLSQAELLGNKEVHIVATETLTLLMAEVIRLMKDSGKNFVSYFSDLLQRCKVQKALLHCLMSVIYNCRKIKKDDKTALKVTEVIMAFNEENLVASANETFQIKLLNFLLVMIMLEEQITKIKGSSDSTGVASEWDRLRVSYQPSLQNIRYNQGHPIVQQGMFLSSILSALKQFHQCHMHRHWVSMVTTALPYMGRYLPGIVIGVVSQLCRNLEALAIEFESNGKPKGPGLAKVPPDHAVTMLDGLITICHYCLLDNVSPVSIGQTTPVSSSISMELSSSANILTNLFHVFNPVGSGREVSPQRDLGTVSPVLDTRTSLLNILPRIIACMASLWRAMRVIEQQEESPMVVMGAPKSVRQYILEFLSPISLPHGTNLLGAIAVAWNDRRGKKPLTQQKRVIPIPCEDQLLLVELVGAIKVLPMDTLIQTVKQVLKQPPPSELSKVKKSVPLEVNMLQFFYAYVERTSASQLLDSWSSLLSLLRDGLQLQLMPPGQFLLLQILNEFVQKTPPMEDKKNQKEVQEMSQRLLEAVSVIAGSSLEQTTWLRRNLAVKPGPQAENGDHDDSLIDEDGAASQGERKIAETQQNYPVARVSDSKYSVSALYLLAELTAPLLDVVYSSEEKDRIAPFLTTLLYNVFPYLKHHSYNNLPSMRACSQILSSISSYQYTRKAWRKETLELLLDPSFFQTDCSCIRHWHTIVDNLMTHDKTTFKDLLTRVAMSQTGSLFSNKEQEVDQKAAMLKRLSFAVFCSESDQYQKSTPEIQEKLAESLKLPQAPPVMAQVFTCFRVLMLRISPQHLTSMWPTIITELIHVFLQMEQELSSETDEFVTQVQRIAALDSSWAHLGNGLNAHNNPAWLQLYLSACKLLDLCLALPAEGVPQFQLYRWAFIGGAAAGEVEEEDHRDDAKHKMRRPSFQPHIIRLARLLNSKLQGDVPVLKVTPGRPFLTLTHLRSLHELQPFFNTLCLASQTDNIHLAAMHLKGGLMENATATHNGHMNENDGGRQERRLNGYGSRSMPKSKSTPDISDVQHHHHMDLLLSSTTTTHRQYIEDLIERDFLEPFN